MKYDDASWRSGGEFPVDSPDEYGGTHIALFLRWCLHKGWVGEMLEARLLSGRLTHEDEQPEAEARARPWWRFWG